MKTVCIGSAVMDITAKPVSQKGSWQEKQRIEDIRIQTGGDAANQSVHLAALGWEPGLISCVGRTQTAGCCGLPWKTGAWIRP